MILGVQEQNILLVTAGSCPPRARRGSPDPAAPRPKVSFPAAGRIRCPHGTLPLSPRRRSLLCHLQRRGLVADLCLRGCVQDRYGEPELLPSPEGPADQCLP